METTLNESAQSSASKMLGVLEAIARTVGESFGVTEVAAEVGLPKSTAHRLLKTLEERGFVERLGARYRVGGRVFELGEAARWSEFGELTRVARRPLARLFEQSDAVAVHLAVLRDCDVLYLEKLTKPAGNRLPSRVGGRFPATCTALGKAILAFSDRGAVADVMSRPLVRATPHSITALPRFVEQLEEAVFRGYSVELEEACYGAICVAAPILRDGKAIAAVSLSVPTGGSSRTTAARLSMHGSLVAEAAASVAELLPDHSLH